MIKNYRTFNESLVSGFKFRDFITIPSDLSTVFDTFKNEVQLCNDLVVTMLYSRILECCLCEHYGLIKFNLDVTQSAKSITKSNSKIEALNQFKEISDPHHILPSQLLRFINCEKKIKFDSISDNFSDTARTFLSSELSGNFPNHISKTRKSLILRSKVSVLD